MVSLVSCRRPVRPILTFSSSSPFSQQYALAGPSSPGSSASSAVYESSCWSSETDIDKKSVPPSALQKGNPPTPPSPLTSSPHTPPSASISLLEAQKVRRAKACDKFTRYSETTPFQRGAPNNTMYTAPVPVQVPVPTLHSAREIPTEPPVQMQWASAIELHRVSSAPVLKQRSQSQPQPQPQPQLQPQLRLHPEWQSQSQSQLMVASQRTPLTPPLLMPPLLTAPLATSSHATPNATPAPAMTTTAPAPEGKPSRASASGHYRRSTGVLLPRVGSLKAILRPRSHSKAAATGVH